jgi:hypothetical protein
LLRVTHSSIWRELHVDSGETPSLSAWASANVLNVEPGWRCPCVARLNGRAV